MASLHQIHWKCYEALNKVTFILTTEGSLPQMSSGGVVAREETNGTKNRKKKTKKEKFRYESDREEEEERDSEKEREEGRERQERVRTADWLRRTSAKATRIVSSRLNRPPGGSLCHPSLLPAHQLDTI